MKIGIITYHFPYNCGAALQCAAMQAKLRQMGHEVCVINYRPWYHQNRYLALKNPVYLAGKMFRDEKGSLLKKLAKGAEGFLRTVYSWRRYGQNRVKDQKFRHFQKEHMQETRVYRTLRQLQSDPPRCDLYLAGSDQLWNAAITGGKFDPAYFLQFGDGSIGRISYSMGADFAAASDAEAQLNKLLEGFDAVSMRESRWAPLVEKAAGGKLPVHIDLDPTMLLSPEDYGKFMAPIPDGKEPYILTYTMPGETQKKVYAGAKKLSEKLGIRLIDVSGQPTAANKRVKDNRICGPDEFLSYVKNASFVVTNSFHGTVFAVLFQKSFITFPHAQTGNRVTELLDKLGLASRYGTNTDEMVGRMEEEIDYEAAFEKLSRLREESVGFLEKSAAEYGRKGEK